MVEQSLEQIHAECVRALRRYMIEANKTCKLLTAIKQFPIDRKTKKEILDQRLLENEAQDLYQRTRRELFSAANWGRSSG
jgi:hypothetical protein